MLTHCREMDPRDKPEDDTSVARLRPNDKVPYSPYEHAGTGVIIPYPTGVVYSNQACGVYCMQPELEGAFVPLGNEFEKSGMIRSVESKLYDYFAGADGDVSLSCDAATFIDNTLDEGLRCWSIKVDRDRRTESMEAWVWVIISGNGQPVTSVITGLGGPPWKGVLTWSNSD